MKKLISLLLVVLMLTLSATVFSACGNEGGSGETEEPTAGEPDATTAEPGDTTAEPAATTAEPTETTQAPETTADPTITSFTVATADDLFTLYNECEKGTPFDECIITFTADIDLAGRNWTPLAGTSLYEVTFDGQGHTISNMTIEGADGATYLGFIGMTYGGTIIFKDLTFDNCEITAKGKECGIIVGQNNLAELRFNNVKVINSKINGYMDYNVSSSLIAFRVAAFVGANWQSGSIEIENCEVKDFTASAFHNLAAFVGYDSVIATTVKNSHVENMTLTFSYCLSASYTIDQANKYIAVFYNLTKWPDTLADALANGNTYAVVKYIDYTTNTEYLPENFRSNYSAG